MTALFQVTPIASLALVGTAQVGRDERPDANFGLQSLDTNAYSFGIETSPTDGVGAGVTYGYEDARTSQKSRQANLARSSTIRRATGSPMSASACTIWSPAWT